MLDSQLVEDIQHHTWYTGISPSTAGTLLLLLPVFHCILVFLLSCLLVPGFLQLQDRERKVWRIGRQGRSWSSLRTWDRVRLLYNRIIYCLTTLLVPRVFRDWDEVNYTNISANMKGNIYYRQWLQVKTQYFWLTIVFLVENLLLLFPALHTSLTILHLHSILPSLPEEDPTLTLSYLLLCSPLLLLSLSFLQFYLFTQYNLRAHTWSLLLITSHQVQVVVRIQDSDRWSLEEVENKLSRLWVSRGLYVSVEAGRRGEGVWVVGVTHTQVTLHQLKEAVGTQEGIVIEMGREELVSGGEVGRKGRCGWECNPQTVSESCLCSE